MSLDRAYGLAHRMAMQSGGDVDLGDAPLAKPGQTIASQPSLLDRAATARSAVADALTPYYLQGPSDQEVAQRQTDLQLGRNVPGKIPAVEPMNPAPFAAVDALGMLPVGGAGKLAATLGMGAMRDVGETGLARGAARALEETAPGWVRAYHGSPHDFDKFDISKIGAGEGAQVYGRGLYFAEKPDVAQFYKNALTKGQRGSVTIGGQPKDITTLTPAESLAVGAVQWAKDRGGEALDQLAKVKPGQLYTQEVLDHARDLIKAGGVSYQSPGRMYDVYIKAHPDKFLNWDHPLNTQHPDVQRAVGDLWEANDLPHDPSHMTGEEVHDELVKHWEKALDEKQAPQAAAADLHYVGIPGIRFLDQGSRRGTIGGEVRPWRDSGFAVWRPNAPNAKTPIAVFPTREEAEEAARGTHNYAVFDDSLIEIMKKYGIAAVPFAGAAGLATQPGGGETHMQRGGVAMDGYQLARRMAMQEGGPADDAPSPPRSKYYAATHGIDVGPPDETAQDLALQSNLLRNLQSPSAVGSVLKQDIVDPIVQPFRNMAALAQSNTPVISPETGRPDPRYIEASTGVAGGLAAIGAPFAEEGALGALGGRGPRTLTRQIPLTTEDTAAINPRAVVGANRPPEEFPGRVSTRLPTGKRATEDPMAAKRLIIDADAMKIDPELFKDNVALVRNYPNMTAQEAKGPADAVAGRFIDHVKSNLLWLYDQISPEVRDRSDQWYDGGNVISHYLAQTYGAHPFSSAAAIAALSPQKDWYQNVSLANRVHFIHYQGGDQPWSEEMNKKAADIYTEPAQVSLLNAIRGKTYNELQHTDEKAAWLRLYDESHNGSGYDILAPEGHTLGPALNKDGSPSKVAWGSNVEIAKAIDALQAHGDLDKITWLLGDRHKVRNFYNNLIEPGSPHDVTIDTHAVAAGLLRPLSGNSVEVSHNFGNYPGKGIPSARSSSLTGVGGTYGLYADAYRQAAAERGILPRQLQSVTWEAIRRLFPDTFKNKKNNAAIDGYWRDYRKGVSSLDETRAKILDFAGGRIPDPDWVSGPDHPGNEAPGHAGDAQELPGPRLSRGGAATMDRRAGNGAAARSAPEVAMADGGAAPDLSGFSDDQLQAITRGDMSGLSEAQLHALAGTTPPAAPQAPQSGVLAESAKGIGRGALSGASSLLETTPGLPMLRSALGAANQLTGANLHIPTYEEAARPHLPVERDPNASVPAQYAGTIAETLANPASWFGPGGWLAKTIMGVTGGAGSEFAGQLAKGTPYEPVARAAGALLGSQGPARAAKPQLGEAQRALAEQGVRLTPGQMFPGPAGVLKGAEDIASSIPILGSFVKGARGRSIESFNRAVADQALEPIGERLNPRTPAGHPLVAEVDRKFSDAYDAIKQNLLFVPDRRFALDINAIHAGPVARMPVPQQEQFAKILDTLLPPHNAQLDGEAFKNIESELNLLARQHQNSPMASEKQLGGALQDVLTAMREGLERSNPGYRDRLQAINFGYAMSQRLGEAAERRGTSGAVFTPSDLLQAIKSSPYTPKGAFRRGDGLMQEFAEAGQRVLPSKIADSGTPERAALMAGMAGAAPFTPKVAAGIAASIPAYTRPGIAALNRWASPTQGMARSAYRQAASGVIPPLRSVLAAPQEDNPYAAGP